jgi:hypothetical protein
MKKLFFMFISLMVSGIAFAEVPTRPEITGTFSENFYVKSTSFADYTSSANTVFADYTSNAERWQLIGTTLKPVTSITVIDISGMDNYTGFPSGASTLQDAYEEGASITTDATNDAVTITDGGGSNGVILDIEKTAGTTVFKITTSFHPGTIVQQRYTSVPRLNTGTTQFSIAGNSKPTIFQGDTYITAFNYTPLDSNNCLTVEAKLTLSSSAGAGHLSAAIFAFGNNTAFTASSHRIGGANGMTPISINGEINPVGTTSLIQFIVNAGANVAGTTTFNGITGSEKFDGVDDSFLKITEGKSCD